VVKDYTAMAPTASDMRPTTASIRIFEIFLPLIQKI
jgi:hypothetical protein